VHLLEVDAKKNLSVNLYINASYISVSHPVKKRPDQKGTKYFIATQAPLENTMLTFWKMVWTNRIDVIYFVTKIVEHGSPVANVYWKFASKEALQEFTVTKVSKKDLGFVVMRELEVSNLVTKEKRVVTQYQVSHSYEIVGWDDNTVPNEDTDVSELLALLQNCALYFEANPTKLVAVHCSAGVGRTGVFMALVFLILRAREQLRGQSQGCPNNKGDSKHDEGSLSVFETVRSLREQRWGSVKNQVSLS
jgi:protein tyrosine phosphatase